ncbi:hypothetical protein PINS_up015625 [Pythium insidiosum]|nr:hypothetical protein PINS_up015625 [Pythium insidiosum]
MIKSDERPDPKSALLAQIVSRQKEEQQPQSTLMSDERPDPKSALLAQIASRQKEEQQPQSTLKSDKRPDPKSALLAQIASRQTKESQEHEVERGGDVTSSGRKLKDVEDFKNYFQMLRLGCHREAVKQKILMDGSDPIILDLDPDASFDDVKSQIKMSEKTKRSTLQDDIKSVKSHTKKVSDSTDCPTVPTKGSAIMPVMAPSSTGAEVLLKDDEQYGKYFKMLKMGIPEGAVRNKMQKEGANEKALELGENAPVSALMSDPTDVCLAEDAVYSKYFKMLKMGLPDGAVRHKMLQDGADVRALELGGQAMVSQLRALTGSESHTKPTTRKTVTKRRKKLHWQPISDDRLSTIDRETIWGGADEEIADIEMDMDELESLFFANTENSTSKKSTAHSKPLKRKQAVTLIDGKRAMNAAISLARIKLSYSDIARAIQNFDAAGLTTQQLIGIREFLPTPEEVSAIAAYSGDESVLGEAEKFMREIGKVKRYVSRTECLVFQLSFQSRRDELQRSLDNVIEACGEVKDSRLLKTLLGMVLKLGNTLNGSGEENEIRGFTVDSLLRLGHTKAVNQKTTVLHYLVRLVKKHHPSVLDFQSEIQTVEKAARESFDVIDEDFRKLQSGLTLLSEEFQELAKETSEANDSSTVHALQLAVDRIGEEIEKLHHCTKRAREEVRSVFDYFGEDPQKNPSDFFSTLASFCAMFGAARKDVDAADEANLRAERLKMRRSASVRQPLAPDKDFVERTSSDRAVVQRRMEADVD